MKNKFYHYKLELLWSGNRMLISLLLSLLYCTYAFSQDSELPKGTPQSGPSFYNSGSSQNVDMSTGGMSQVFPIASIQGKSLSADVSAVYTQGQGIRVNDIGSQIRLGFQLSAGGTITREVRGIPDDNIRNPFEPLCLTDLVPCAFGGEGPTDTIFTVYYSQVDPIGQRYLYGWFNKFDFHRIQVDEIVNKLDCKGQDTTWVYPESYLDQMNMGELVEEFKNDAPSQWLFDEAVWRRLRFRYFENTARGAFDTEPDLFRFQFGNYSGSFVFKPDGTPVLTENMDIIIEPAIGPQSGLGTQWVFITPDGTRYIFTDSDTFREKTRIVSETGYPDQVNPCNNQNESESVLEYYSTWHLSKVESALNESIEFVYDVDHQMVVTSYNQIDQQIYDLGFGFSCDLYDDEYPRFTELASVQVISSPKIFNSIIYKKNDTFSGRIIFIYSGSIYYYDNHRVLESVEQLDYKNQLISKTRFDYGSLSHGRVKLESITQLPIGAGQQNFCHQI